MQQNLDNIWRFINLSEFDKQFKQSNEFTTQHHHSNRGNFWNFGRNYHHNRPNSRCYRCHDHYEENHYDDINTTSLTTENSVTQISVYYQNLRGLCSRYKRFFCTATSCDYHVIILTETWLKNFFQSAEYFDNSYAVFRKDRIWTAEAFSLHWKMLFLPVNKSTFQLLSIWKMLLYFFHSEFNLIFFNE